MDSISGEYLIKIIKILHLQMVAQLIVSLWRLKKKDIACSKCAQQQQTHCNPKVYDIKHDIYDILQVFG